MFSIVTKTRGGVVSILRGFETREEAENVAERLRNSSNVLRPWSEQSGSWRSLNDNDLDMVEILP